jgi:glutamine synthetase
MKYQAQVVQAVTGARQAGIEDAEQTQLLAELIERIGQVRSAVGELDEAISGQGGDTVEHARYMHETVLEKLGALRRGVDAVEMVMDDQSWPMPTYREMLFIR